MIAEAETVVTRKGQITIPVSIRRALSLREGDRIAWAMEGQEVRLVRRPGVVDRTAGMFHHGGAALAAEELRLVAESAISGDRRLSADGDARTDVAE